MYSINKGIYSTNMQAQDGCQLTKVGHASITFRRNTRVNAKQRVKHWCVCVCPVFFNAIVRIYYDYASLISMY